MNRDGWATLAHALLRARGFIDRYDDPQLEAWLFGMLMGTDSNWWFDKYDPYEGYTKRLADLVELGLDDDGYTEYVQ